jgi:hypothetical protein
MAKPNYNKQIEKAFQFFSFSYIFGIEVCAFSNELKHVVMPHPLNVSTVLIG